MRISHLRIHPLPIIFRLLLPPTLNQSIPREDIHSDFDKGFCHRHDDGSEDSGIDYEDHELGHFGNVGSGGSVTAIVPGVLLDRNAMCMQCNEKEAQ